MNRKLKAKLGAAIFALALGSAPVLAHPPIPERSAHAEKTAFEADRADILAMAGNYKVRFDMQESTPWNADYEPRERKISGGHEVVRVIEDSGKKIVLQHLLVARMDDGTDFIVKHWRQDWQYEPAQILAYSDRNSWEYQPVSEKRRNGRWSQTVYQVDDSPRYASLGEWETQGGIRRWRSGWTWRPLARRDAVRDTPYDRYYAINRHSPTPDGWIHFQDNIKMGMVDGKLVPIVSEYVLNTYTKFDDYNVQAADDYWAKTKDYWAKVRNSWEEAFASGNGVTVEEEAQTGTVISGELLEMGTKIANGELDSDSASKKAVSLIANATRPGAVQTAKKVSKSEAY
ncbi:DUF6607 family protein [Parasphingorhabdus sp. JC815]|uniref:DUF6607 family protein n=1 Tax=Parasphingorhabdus sp. JC815 TaxID=3232140 RepID=UPI003457A5BB